MDRDEKIRELEDMIEGLKKLIDLHIEEKKELQRKLDVVKKLFLDEDMIKRSLMK